MTLEDDSTHNQTQNGNSARRPEIVLDDVHAQSSPSSPKHFAVLSPVSINSATVDS